jgi:ferritin-like metal-binding protein YciE
MAEMGNEMPAVDLLKQSLHEEEEMAHWIDEHLRSLTMSYVERRERGIQADR